MAGWMILGGIFLGLVAITLHENKTRQILIGATYVVVFLVVAATTQSLLFSTLGGAACSLALSIWIYQNVLNREFERKERERYERECEERNRQWEARMNELMNSD